MAESPTRSPSIETIAEYDLKMQKFFRFSLKQFILVCVCLGLVAAWLGLRNQIQRTANSGDTKWHSFAPSGGFRGDAVGGVQIDGYGRASYAAIRDPGDFKKLAELPNACQSLTSALIFGRETLEEFDPADFPNIEQLSIAGGMISASLLKKLRLMSKLTDLSIAEFEIDPSTELEPLCQLPNLRHLKIKSNQIKGLERMPSFDQLTIFTVDCTAATQEDVDALKKRLTSCEVLVNVAPYRNGRVDHVWIR